MEQIMILSKEGIGSILDEVRGISLEEHGILPSSFIGGCGAVYVRNRFLSRDAEGTLAELEQWVLADRAAVEAAARRKA
jgi:hypothetical protein